MHYQPVIIEAISKQIFFILSATHLLTLVMGAVEQLQFLVGVSLFACVAAGEGEDFSNNLFSDLAP